MRVMAGISLTAPLAWIVMQPVEQPIDRVVVVESVFDDVKMRGRNVVADKGEAMGIGGADSASSKRKVEPDVIVETRKKIGAADIRQKPNADLRHGHPVAFARHAMGAVERDADAATEQETIDEGNVRPD
jgi:hypothetical protein